MRGLAIPFSVLGLMGLGTAVLVALGLEPFATASFMAVAILLSYSMLLAMHMRSSGHV